MSGYGGTGVIGSPTVIPVMLVEEEVDLVQVQVLIVTFEQLRGVSD